MPRVTIHTLLWRCAHQYRSCLFVKRRSDLISALSITPSYLRNAYSESGLVTDYRDWQIPLGRRFRALKIWFVMRTYGITGLQAHIRKHIALGDLFHSLVLSRPDLFKVFTPPAFALTVFSVVPSTAKKDSQASVLEQAQVEGDFTPDAEEQAAKEADAVTKAVYDKVFEQGQIFITSSVVNGRYVIRVVSANPMAEEKYVRNAFDILVRTAEEVLQ